MEILCYIFDKNDEFYRYLFEFLFNNSRVAQWKRAGPITQRSVDRNHALLSRGTCIFNSHFTVIKVKLSNFKISDLKYCAPSEDRTHDLKIMRLTRYLLRH